ncbi:D-alanyl-D-alanine carboxypeptidase family protein [Candidatus Contubernalis alkaliaceticus]|uniref:D-alanyl-D-alanine carboxypeptidase family protein n=1 Tax=Candidatus Contubernalis alkaliaceticus TaxID=338645 RepID=UPI001F4C3BFF|nr:D-alanyl-D-alanine carboxypeptidase family protein [Candidatus Contubernalis alkalaceticus]UNC92316.1 D-alanyl-D-alanine carboxypeptidase [Candidatus Contubernalis alkalaceticus]
MRKTTLAPNAKAAILVQIGPNNKVLFKKRANKKLHIASITKLMTMLIVLDGLDSGEIKWTDMVETSSAAASIYGSRINLKAGEKLSVKNMFKSMIIASGNDAAIALAEHFSGTMNNFADRMNRKAKELGLRNSHFVNSHGLFEDNHYSSALDIAKMAIVSLKREEIIKYSKLKYDYIRRENNQLKKLVNTNRLIGIIPEADGLKTGHTPLAGYCLVATALMDNIRLLAVVLGEPSKAARDKEVIKMLDYGFKAILLKIR